MVSITGTFDMKLTAFGVIALYCLFSSLNQGCTKKQFKAEGFELKHRVPLVTVTTTAKDESELPLCEVSTQNVTIFLAQANSFMKCVNGAWHKARPGDRSTSFASRAPVRYYEWQDPTQKKIWSVQKDSPVASDQLNENTCHGQWKLPTQEELLTATSNGLFEGIKSHGGVAFEQAWTQDFEVVDGISHRVAVSLLPYPTKVQTREAGIYCVSANG